MFGLAAARRERVGDTKLNKFDAQSIPMIAVGRCQNSNGLQFYNPVNGSFVSSVDYKFQPHTTSGTRFGYKYQPGTFLYRLDESNTVFTPKYNLESSVIIHTHSLPHKATIIGLQTYDKPDVYTVVFADGTITKYSDSDNFIESIPQSQPIKTTIILPSWVQNGANTTLFLSSMSKPHHGKLRLDSKQQWIFTPGNSTDLSKGILLVVLVSNFQQLMDTGQLFKGHTKFYRVYHTRTQVQLKDSVLRHVSTHGLQSLVAPISLSSHQKMSESDKSIWDAANNEEFDGLNNLPTWEVLTESQFKSLSKGIKALPSMTLATIKYDAFNRPKRAKYRIVVLGNHDYHTWSNKSTATPVMSQLELRLFTALAISQRRVLKNCDIKQAFVKSSLPEDEHYFVRPPKGCPRSQPGTYWKLIRSLYGLRRAPKLWYEKFSSHLRSMGLKQFTTSPCIFIGHPVAGSPPIYVGIYVDDIIYFSVSDDVEKWFEANLSTIGDVDFMGKVTHFLGIEFTWNELPDGHLCVSLTQQSFIESLLDSLNISVDGISTYTSPYRSGVNIHSIPYQDMNSIDRDRLRLQYQSLVGSPNWLAHTTRPDISTVVSLLAQHQSQPSPGHYDAALYVAHYLAMTRSLGIYFTNTMSSTLESFLHFPLSQPLISMSDAN
jgi:hypothetical protein